METLRRCPALYSYVAGSILARKNHSNIRPLHGGLPCRPFWVYGSRSREPRTPTYQGQPAALPITGLPGGSRSLDWRWETEGQHRALSPLVLLQGNSAWPPRAPSASLSTVCERGALSRLHPHHHFTSGIGSNTIAIQTANPVIVSSPPTRIR